MLRLSNDAPFATRYKVLMPLMQNMTKIPFLFFERLNCLLKRKIISTQILLVTKI
jgi:hypothetical protein